MILHQLKNSFRKNIDINVKLGKQLKQKQIAINIRE